MGALPKRKISSHRRGRRRRHIQLTPVNLTTCPNCGKFKRPHQACSSCGHYGPPTATTK